MKTYQVQIKSVSPYASSRCHGTPKLDRETADAYEQRTWRNKLTTDDDGNGIIRADAFKFCLSAAAKYLGLQVPGKGKRTYTKIFEAGILVVEPMPLGVKPADFVAEHERKPGQPFGKVVHCNADGVRGSGKRVFRTFPTVPAWAGTLTIEVLDDAITEDVLRQHLDIAGKYVGVGQYAPNRGGTNGRFEIGGIKEI